jgi:hypothetical protein
VRLRVAILCALVAAEFAAPVGAHAQRGVRMPAPPTPDQFKPDTTARARPAKAVAIGTLDGLVTDSTLRPIADAEVTILRTSLKIRTGENGRFRFTQMPAGQYLIIVRRLGYHPTSEIVEVPPNDTLRSAFSLDRVPQGMDTVHVVTERRSFRMMEFEDRRKLGEGQFLTQDDIDKHGVAGVADLIRRFNGVNIKDDRGRVGGGGQLQQYAVSRRGDSGDYCVMQVVLDDVLLPKPFDLTLLPSPRQIAGIELYTGSATLPARYNGLDAWCGLLLIWTKDGQ